MDLPLKGIRVVDATNSWAGPYTTQILASFGAQVIKVESIQYIDTWRGSGTAAGTQETFWERSPLWNSVNAGKLGITLNLREPRGAELFKRLVKVSDIVAENFTPRVMKNFELDYAVLSAINPGIVMISLPAHGGTGPWSDYVGFAASIEQMAGIPQLTGYPDGPPKMSSSGFTDPISGVTGAIAVMTALVYRQATGKGQHIDLSQVEATTSLIGDAIMDFTMNGKIQARRGNHHPSAAPHGYYRCQGDDQWIALAIYTDEEWQRFCHVTSNSHWAEDSRFIDSFSRWQNKVELDKLVESWTVHHEHYEVMNLLQREGITAGAVLSSMELLNDPHLKARGTYKILERDIVGRHPYPVPTSPMRMDCVQADLASPAPTMGQHNNFVLREILGLSPEEIQALVVQQVIGNRPLGL